jgi:hypothetical protein
MIGDAASHEAGHAFGLSHQRVCNTMDIALIHEYNPGSPEQAHLMENSYSVVGSL